MDAEQHARRALRAQGEAAAQEALTALSGAEGASWARAVAATWLGDGLRAQIALRGLDRGEPLPPDAALDVALPLADAALDDAPTLAAWVRLATRVPVSHPPPTALHLAWEVVINAADLAPEQSHDHARLVLAMGSLADRLGRPEAGSLLRAAQEHARRLRSADLLVESTVALVRFHRDDTELTDDLVRWAAREVASSDEPGAVARLHARVAAARAQA